MRAPLASPGAARPFLSDRATSAMCWEFCDPVLWRFGVSPNLEGLDEGRVLLKGCTGGRWLGLEELGMGDPDFRPGTGLGEEEASVSRAQSCTRSKFF